MFFRATTTMRSRVTIDSARANPSCRCWAADQCGSTKRGHNRRGAVQSPLLLVTQLLLRGTAHPLNVGQGVIVEGLPELGVIPQEVLDHVDVWQVGELSWQFNHVGQNVVLCDICENKRSARKGKKPYNKSVGYRVEWCNIKPASQRAVQLDQIGAC